MLFKYKKYFVRKSYLLFQYSWINEKNKNKFKVNSNINILPIFDKCISLKIITIIIIELRQKNANIYGKRNTTNILHNK